MRFLQMLTITISISGLCGLLYAKVRNEATLDNIELKACDALTDAIMTDSALGDLCNTVTTPFPNFDVDCAPGSDTAVAPVNDAKCTAIEWAKKNYALLRRLEGIFSNSGETFDPFA